MDYYDFYEETSEFDGKVDELKECLMKSLKSEITNEMDQLREENRALQEIKSDFEKIKQDYENKKRDLERNIRHAHLSELMKDSEVELFTVATSYKSKPKCNKCDDDRRIHYTTPMGRRTYETCLCGEETYVYEPVKTLLNTFSIENGRGVSWYKVQSDSKNERLGYFENSISRKDALITKEDQFKDVGYVYKTLFKTEELAQKFCDYKNKGVSADD